MMEDPSASQGRLKFTLNTDCIVRSLALEAAASLKGIVWLHAVLLPQGSPAIAPALPPTAAPAPAAPLCPGGVPGAWRCGAGNSSLLFDEATHQQLLSTYPAHCTAVTADALLCGSVLLTADAQSALSAGACTYARLTLPSALSPYVCAVLPLCLESWNLILMTLMYAMWYLCRHVCDQVKPCFAVAPAPQPALAPVQAPVVSFLECPVGMSQVSCSLACALSWPVFVRLHPSTTHTRLHITWHD